MRYLLALGLLVALAGCGGQSKVDSAPPSPSSSATSADLRQTCGALAKALPADTYDPAQMRGFLDELAAMNNHGNTSVRTTLRPLADPVASLAGGVSVRAHQQFLTALNDFADACRAAGSTALD